MCCVCRPTTLNLPTTVWPLASAILFVGVHGAGITCSVSCRPPSSILPVVTMFLFLLCLATLYYLPFFREQHADLTPTVSNASFIAILLRAAHADLTPTVSNASSFAASAEKRGGVLGGRGVRAVPRSGNVLLPGDRVVRLLDAAAAGGGRGNPQVSHRLAQRPLQGDWLIDGLIDCRWWWWWFWFWRCCLWLYHLFAGLCLRLADWLTVFSVFGGGGGGVLWFTKIVCRFWALSRVLVCVFFVACQVLCCRVPYAVLLAQFTIGRIRTCCLYSRRVSRAARLEYHLCVPRQFFCAPLADSSRPRVIFFRSMHTVPGRVRCSLKDSSSSL